MFLTFMSNRLIAVLAAAVLFLPSLVVAADAERGEVIFDTCIGCHGADSYNNVYPTYKVPLLVGQWPEYIVAALQAYQSGERTHPTMVAQAGSFDIEDMQDIAAYLATKGEFAGGEAKGAAPAAAATCVACHGPAGQSIANIYPNLAGQYQDYLAQAIRAYKSGKRNNVQMGPLVQTLTEADIDSIAAFYSAQSGLVKFPK
jgi:cytochrome c553